MAKATFLSRPRLRTWGITVFFITWHGAHHSVLTITTIGFPVSIVAWWAAA